MRSRSASNARAIEIGLMSPGQPGAALGRQRVLQRLLVDLLDALEIEAFDVDVALLSASAETQRATRRSKKRKRSPRSRHAVCAVTQPCQSNKRQSRPYSCNTRCLLVVVTAGRPEATASMMPKPTAITRRSRATCRECAEDPGLPERHPGANQQDEVADEVELQESHDAIKAERVPTRQNRHPWWCPLEPVAGADYRQPTEPLTILAGY